MDAWTSLVRNGKVGQDIAIAHPSPDDGISPCPRLLKPDEPWKTPHRGLLRSWTYTASLLSSTPAGRNSRRLGRGDRSSTPQSAAGSLTSVSEDHADEPNDESNMQLYSSREQFTLPIVFDLL